MAPLLPVEETVSSLQSPPHTPPQESNFGFIKINIGLSDSTYFFKTKFSLYKFVFKKLYFPLT